MASVLRFYRLSSDATAPSKANAMDAGYDLHASEDATIGPNDSAMVRTDIAVELPPGCYGRIGERSGLARKKKIRVGGGVVDRGYEGPLGVILFNHDVKETFVIRKGDRIAQLIIERHLVGEVVDVRDGPPARRSARGASGFGSTGR